MQYRFNRQYVEGVCDGFNATATTHDEVVTFASPELAPFLGKNVRELIDWARMFGIPWEVSP